MSHLDDHLEAIKKQYFPGMTASQFWRDAVFSQRSYQGFASDSDMAEYQAHACVSFADELLRLAKERGFVQPEENDDE